MNMIFFVFYTIVIITIIANVLKIVRAFKQNDSMFRNVQDIVNERYNEIIPNDTFGENKTNNTEKEVNLDEFLKSNTNPVKEKRGKGSKI